VSPLGSRGRLLRLAPPGILALDEPTTNLDAANSASLASALMDIMNSRREQESFQLIVITHDVRFAHQLGSREHAEYYWRISSAPPRLPRSLSSRTALAQRMRSCTPTSRRRT